MLGLVVLFFLLSKARSTAVAMVNTKPPANVTPTDRVNTGGPTWKADRYKALAAHGISGEIARSIVAMWHFETNGGAAEWNFNVGNRIALGGDKGIHLDDGGGPGWYKAYATLDDAVAEYLALLQSSRYATCWTLLQENPTDSGWVRCLGQHGYYTANPDVYVKGYENRRALVAP